MSEAKTVSVLLPIPTDGPYSYTVPEGMSLRPGDYVKVPLGSREVAAVVWDPTDNTVDPKKLREVSEKFECPPMKEPMRRFIEWVAGYTVSPPGMVLKMVLRVPAALDPEPDMPGLAFSGSSPDRLTSARQAVMSFADHGLNWTKSGLAHAAGVTPSVVDGLVKQGALETIMLPPQALQAKPDAEYGKQELSTEQTEVAEALSQTISSGDAGVTVLEGVTGSGKTEVYFEALAACFATGKQALVLIPEIALTATFLERFENRFGTRPAEWHSELAPRAREKTWRQVATGQLQVVAGARSALYLPFENLGLIIVDEEHDLAYKQEDRVFYNARDMAVLRGQMEQCPVVLCSATPSIETRVNAQLGRYRHLKLESRFGDAVLPKLSSVDLRRDPPKSGKFLSPVLMKAVGETIERGEQALLFLNRRGYAPLTLCRVCGHRFECKNCSAWLVEHRFRNVLQCHHCGHNEPTPEACSNCGTLDHLVACGPGVERLAEETLDAFPDARTIVLSSDMAGGVKRMRAELDAIAQGEADIIIGTQLVAKGHNFPLMTLVGVVDADLGLANGDPRAAERTFQLLHQVTGRAGRAGGESVGLLQSYQPEHPVIASIIEGVPEKFFSREIEARKNTSLPPFGKLVSIIISGKDKRETETYARELRLSCPLAEDVRVLGPAEAPLALVRGRYRFRLLIHSPRGFNVQNWIRNWFKSGPKPRGNLRVQIDVDPQSFV
ncbi:MAG: primosomal protein N' [Rhizobiaceae bacterium]|nr:primosomal protein N' [Rhizobiaceae bacterium]